MKRMLALGFAFILFSGAGWLWYNEDAVDSWISDQLIVPPSEDERLLGLQTNEHWLVVVVDFESSPSSNGWGTDDAQNLLNQAAAPYVEQLSGGASTLTIHVHPDVIRAAKNVEAYGTDGSAKDTDSSGVFLPEALAEDVVLRIKNDVEWAQFDLNDDGSIDRFLILHTTKGQEENPSSTSRIWSHFTRFDSQISLPNDHSIDHYTMASLQTGSSGVGTMMHEMLHQMGAADLYPVHDEGSFQSWKGPGDWDIMASGNWNGGGRWPAMPTGASMELINAPRIDSLVLEWPSDAPKPCIGTSIQLEGITEGGRILKIQIAPREFIFIEHRSDSGYDTRLPGHGILVTYQDLSVGDLAQNELNTNPDVPWLKVVEADQGGDLVSGANQGEQSDLFGNNTSFGAEGVPIRTHDGILVPWTATVEIVENTTTISFRSIECSPMFSVDFQDHGSTLLVGEDLPVSIVSTEACTSSLQSSDGRAVTLEPLSTGYVLRFATDGVSNSVFSLEGTISCGSGAVDILHEVRLMNRIPMLSSYEATIDPFEASILTLPISSSGQGDQVLSVSLDGPLSRVANAPTNVNLASGELDLEIEPNGLLTNNMLVYGTVTLSTQEGIAWSLDVELKASDSDSAGIDAWTSPARIYALFLSLLGFIMLSTAFRRQIAIQPSPVHPIQREAFHGYTSTEEFAEPRLSASFDVQE